MIILSVKKARMRENFEKYKIYLHKIKKLAK